MERKTTARGATGKIFKNVTSGKRVGGKKPGGVFTEKVAVTPFWLFTALKGPIAGGKNEKGEPDGGGGQDRCGGEKQP